MCPYFAQGGVDHAIATLAARQYGLVTRAQLAAASLEPRTINRRLAAGRLHRVHAGVYAVGHEAARREARWLAAVLACGDGAVLSHRSAASLWTIREGEGPLPDVTVDTRNGRRQPGIAVHRVPLEPQDRSLRAGIPVTSTARTLVDLAHVLAPDELTRALREAQFQRRFDLEAIRELLTRRPSRTLRALIEDLTPTQTVLEDRLLTICDRHNLPHPKTQQPVLGHRVDFLWPDRRVVAETDGWQAHGTRTAFQTDRAISNALQLAGYTILRFTDFDLRRRPAHVAREIRAALDRG
jgi:very-short-patch-repair endonuclease